MTESNQPGGPGPTGGAVPGASAILENPGSQFEPMAKADIWARLAEKQRDAKVIAKDPDAVREYKELRQEAMRPEWHAGQGVNPSIEGVGRQMATRNRIQHEGTLIAIDADAEVSNHELNNLLVSAADKQFAARERAMLIRDPVFQDRALGKAGSSERIYGLDGGRKFTAREWLQRLDRTLLARVAK